MLSIIFASRIKDNPPSRLDNLFDSTVKFCTQEELKNIEFIIKFDNDDDQIPSQDFFDKWPFQIKYCKYERGEGRHAIHEIITYLYTLRDQRSKFVLNLSDDFVFTRPGFVNEILSVQNSYTIIGGAYDGWVIPDFTGKHLRDVHSWRYWVAEYCPIIGIRALESVQNFGWQSAIDFWALALAVSFHEQFGFSIWHNMQSFYIRKDDYRTSHKDMHAARYVYNLMEDSAYQSCKNPYYFDLIEQQAKNIYLNMKYDGLIK